MVLNWIRTSCNLARTSCNHGIDDSSNSFPGSSLPTLGTRLKFLGKISISSGCRLRHRQDEESGSSKYALVRWCESFVSLYDECISDSEYAKIQKEHAFKTTVKSTLADN